MTLIDGHKAFKVRKISFLSAESFWEYSICVDDWPRILGDLEKLTLAGENWDFAGAQNKSILRNYLLFSFYKANMDGQVEVNGEEAIFNTGLVDNNYDDIYCFLKKNTQHDVRRRPYEIGAFACWGKREQGKLINSIFPTRPAAPTYITADNISDIYFDPNKSISTDFDHIIRDNFNRLPIDFIIDRIGYDGEILEISRSDDVKTALGKISQIVCEYTPRGNKFFRDLRNGIGESIDTAIRYCKWNYKTAILIYYLKKKKISLLLPLALTPSDNGTQRFDVALVVERLPNGNYQGQTILTLAMAYTSARQICRPNSEWLTMEKISDSDVDE